MNYCIVSAQSFMLKVYCNYFTDTMVYCVSIVQKDSMNYTLSDHKHIFSAKNFLIALFLCAGILIQAQEGALDTTFNSAGTQPGVVLTIIGIDGAQNYTVAIQSNGRIITAGSNNSDFILARYLEDGTLDTNFGGTGPQPGVVTTPIGVGAMSLVNGLAIQADDKIIQEMELLNCITWTAPITGIAPVSYRVYRDVALTQRIAMVPASGPLLYCDQNRQKGVTYTYYIVSVDAENNVSTPVSATITS